MAHERPNAFMGERGLGFGQFVRAAQLEYG